MDFTNPNASDPSRQDIELNVPNVVVTAPED